MSILGVTVTLGIALTSSFMLATLVPLYGASIGLSSATIGALVSSAFVAPLVLGIPIGRRVDRLGARPHLMLGATALATLPWLVAAKPELWALAVLQIGAGTAQTVLMIAGQASVAASGDGAVRLRNLGWYSVSISAANLVAPFAAGAIVDLYGFRTAFAAAALVSLAAVVATAFLRIPRPVPTESVPLRAAMAAVWASPTARMGMVASSVVLMTLVINQAFLPVLLTRQGASATAIGGLLSLVALSSIAVRPFLARVVPLLGGPASAIVAVSLLVASGAALTGLAPIPAALVVAALALGLGSGVSQPTSMELVLTDTDRRHRGAALGLRVSVNRVAQILGPLLLGFGAAAMGPAAAFVGAGVASAAVVLATRAAGRRGAAAISRAGEDPSRRGGRPRRG